MGNLMAAELEYAVSKSQTLSPKHSTRQREDLQLDTDSAPSVTPAAPLGNPKEVYRAHQIRSEVFEYNNEEVTRRAIERVKQVAPGMYMKQDLIGHVKRLQEKVVPVVKGEASDAPVVAPAAVREVRTATNGEK